jgi:plastocyanin
MKHLPRRPLYFLVLVLLTTTGRPLLADNQGSFLTGSLEGTLMVTAPPRPKAITQSANSGGFFYDDDESQSSPAQHPLPEEVVIYLEDVPGSYPPPKQHVQLDQKFLQFTHRVLPVLKGTTVDFTNHDPVYHNVFSNSRVNAFDLGRKGRGQRASAKMMVLEVPVNVYCEIHSSMKADILVLANPFFTTVTPGAKFKIEGIPPGTYKMVAWHDYWKPVEQEVTIEKGTTTQAAVTLTTVQK